MFFLSIDQELNRFLKNDYSLHKNNTKDLSVGINKGKFSEQLLPTEYLEAIGQVSVNFGYLERTVLATISELISVEPSFINRLIGGDNFSVLITKFEKTIIFQLRYNGLIKKDCSNDLSLEIKNLVKKLDDINSKRNKFIHSFWSLDEDGVVTITKFMKKTKKTSIIDGQTVGLESIKELDQEITDCRHSLENFKNKVFNLLNNKNEKR